MTTAIIKKKRCAVYTRKSSEEGLDQDYNSIDAQRDAGHAYIASQRNEGWIAVQDDYDDPAYSGGNLERPAMQRLLKDIEAGAIDVVVVYKIDRLTRSLIDFSKMIQIFDEHQVSFISVTQSFNTTTSMGRLILNILLSFAQFEREVTGERIRDKFTASKKKGLWMGGIPPLGYDVKDRCLVINKKEADTIKHIFTRFVELGSSTRLYKELQDSEMTTKSWTTQAGKFRPGKPITRGLIYKLLNNKTYLGKLRHKEKWYEGKHEAIITQSLWDDVHEILSINAHTRGNQTRAKIPFLLKGLVYGDNGYAMTPWSSSKKKSGKRYRYYLNTAENKQCSGISGLPRIPAGKLEAIVLEQMRSIFQTPTLCEKIANTCTESGVYMDDAQVTVAFSQMNIIWDQLFPDEQHRIMKLLINKVIVYPNKIDIRLQTKGFDSLLQELHTSPTMEIDA